MFSIEFTKQYLKDLKLARKRNLDENKLNDIIQKLINDEPLPEKNKVTKKNANTLRSYYARS